MAENQDSRSSPSLPSYGQAPNMPQIAEVAGSSRSPRSASQGETSKSEKAAKNKNHNSKIQSNRFVALKHQNGSFEEANRESCNSPVQTAARAVLEKIDGIFQTPSARSNDQNTDENREKSLDESDEEVDEAEEDSFEEQEGGYPQIEDHQ